MSFNEASPRTDDAPLAVDPFLRETAAYVKGLTSNVTAFEPLLQSVADGDAEIRLKKQFLLRAIDETWVRAVEDSLPALDRIIRNPSRFIEETDRVLPIEISRNITSRSIRHLAQHTDYISDIDEDGNITPNKILNVFHDETIMTYENKFVNTLLNRLYGFVSRRYEKALEHPEDAKRTELSFSDSFAYGETKGKIHVSLELEEVPKEGEVVKNYTYTLDLWRRVERIHRICIDYMNSSFVRNMDKTYIRPPVMRTNAILKNRELRQCLALWEFLEEYQNTGCNLLVEESLETVSDAYIRELYSTLSAEYLLFLHRVRSGFDKDSELAHTKSEEVLRPKIVDDLVPVKSDDFDEHALRHVPRAVATEELTDDDRYLLECMEIALDAAEELLRAEKAAEETEAAPLEVAVLRRHLRRSFTAKLIQAPPFLQDAYGTLKNLLLSYRGVRSRVSWSYDSFRASRLTLARLAIRGKTLVLYLALNPSEYNSAKYHHTDSSGVKKYADTPFTLKIRSARALRYAGELIAELMQKQRLLQEALPQVDYHLPFETTRALYDRGLIRGDGKIPDEELERLLRGNGDRLDTEEDEEEKPGFGGILFKRSFLARLIQSGEQLQKNYTTLKNRLLSYRNIHSRVGWEGDSFRFGRQRLFRLSVRGKTLVLHLALDPSDYPVSKYHHTDCSEVGKFKDLPMRLKIRSDRSLKYALELIDERMQKSGIPKGDAQSADYSMPYESTEALLEKGLIRKAEKAGVIARAEKMFQKAAPDNSAEAIPAMHALSGADETVGVAVTPGEEVTENAPDIPAGGTPFPKEILAAEDAPATETTAVEEGSETAEPAMAEETSTAEKVPMETTAVAENPTIAEIPAEKTLPMKEELPTEAPPQAEQSSTKEPPAPMAPKEPFSEEAEPASREEKSPFLRRLQGWLRGKRKK